MSVKNQKKKYTTAFGIPVGDDQNSLTAGERGPVLMRNMNGYSSHTYKWYNKKDEYFWVQYHFKTDQGIKNLTRQEAEIMRAKDPDHATRDLYEAIKRGDYPSWTLQMQIMTPEQAKDYRFDILDITKVWPHADFPPIEVGKLVLNRNPENYFSEVEQPKNTHENSYQRDGFMRTDSNSGGGPNYWPNSFNGPEPDISVKEPSIEISGIADRYKYSHPNDDFVQPGNLYRDVMKAQDRENLAGNICNHLGGAQKRIQLRQTALFFKADPDYGRHVAKGLKLDIKEIENLANMSDDERMKATS